MMRVIFSTLVVLSVCISLVSCSPWGTSSSEKPNILVIAVESLNFESANCADENPVEKDGFVELCQTSLRFTHFYVTSTLSQPNMATLLTGLDASEHKVVQNGNSSIPVELTTLPERALQVGYRTAFFSGGPPFLAKSGFQQGYEFFNDGFISDERGFTSSENLLNQAEQWWKDKNQPVFLTLYLADLQFPFVKTYSDEKREREASVYAQRQEVGESLATFFSQLKKQKLWDNTYVVLVGLKGDSMLDRKGTLWRENLFRENVHVPLFIKPPQSRQKNSLDTLVSIKQLGELLRDLVEQSTLGVEYVHQKMDKWVEKPLPYMEVVSDWGAWWFGWAPEVSFRTYEYLIFPKKNMQIFHSLEDRSEALPLAEHQVAKEKIRWIKYRVDESYDRPSTIKNELYDFLKKLRAYKLRGGVDINEIFLKENDSEFSKLVAADQALRTSDWNFLLQSYLPTSQYVAAKNLQNENVKINLLGDCERLFKDNKREGLLRRCRDHLFLSLLDWERHRSAEDALLWEKSFMRKFRFYMQYKRMAYINLYLELNWDLDVNTLVGPSLTELYLHLPDKASLRKKIEDYQIPMYAGFPN